ncbi:MAG: GNAT family N-acetyltransferase [SAR324 cluster bacterium]|uniref:GNAT family N-acetyltransferase n=1 Tax=SAR324 cluster bacterium TaxID=2024889 RepID=A0A7X9FU12_9DELT|nr:GNAT family N-acetyltransferase [SAR324 cluster bacterium]
MEHFDLWTIYEGDSNHVIAGAITNMVKSGGQKFGWIPYLFTEGDSRRQGIGKKMDELICSEAASQGAIGMFLEIVDPKRISVEEREREIRFYNQGLDETLFSPEGRLAFWKACDYQEVGMHFISVGYETPYMLMFKYLSPEQIGSKTISAKTVNEAILCNLGWRIQREILNSSR